jgi:6-phosphofructokinase 2
MPQIVTLTINPAVDISWEVHDVVATRKLRSGRGTVFPGGGGINVSHVISELGGESTAVFTQGGVIGTLLTELLDDYAIDARG